MLQTHASAGEMVICPSEGEPQSRSPLVSYTSESAPLGAGLFQYLPQPFNSFIHQILYHPLNKSYFSHSLAAICDVWVPDFYAFLHDLLSAIF